MNPEINQRIALLRGKIADGSITEEEMKEGVKILREGRISAAYSAEATKRKKAIAAVPAAADMLDELENL